MKVEKVPDTTYDMIGGLDQQIEEMKEVLMATNRIDMLDQALLRPGRIDRKIEFPNPNVESRLGILKIHSRKMNLMRGIDLKKIAEKMNGASGAELKAVCTEAGMFALRERRVHVTQEDCEMAVAKVMKQDEKNPVFEEAVEVIDFVFLVIVQGGFNDAVYRFHGDGLSIMNCDGAEDVIVSVNSTLILCATSNHLSSLSLLGGILCAKGIHATSSEF
ncbi:hypothetical protein Vadar_014660 [Vaccinium darrowii]|uniref:Uncharacterized protein n=1 Tax=Vaccinium darrowii TaxID=229202 RepID=A0ACB7Y0Q4_9ERIC|nr:hypothetical protein Vadar_014660 [Vaccinium darrowii]